MKTKHIKFPSAQRQPFGSYPVNRIECKNCGNPSAALMLHDDLWLSIVNDRKDFLCLVCIEEKLGRAIKANDLNNAPINDALKTVLRRLEATVEAWNDG